MYWRGKWANRNYWMVFNYVTHGKSTFLRKKKLVLKRHSAISGRTCKIRASNSKKSHKKSIGQVVRLFTPPTLLHPLTTTRVLFMCLPSVEKFLFVKATFMICVTFNSDILDKHYLYNNFCVFQRKKYQEIRKPKKWHLVERKYENKYLDIYTQTCLRMYLKMYNVSSI